MSDTTRAALAAIAALHDGTDFAKLTKADLFEALKRARHMAKVALHEAPAHAHP